jgi:hypothetical protein
MHPCGRSRRRAWKPTSPGQIAVHLDGTVTYHGLPQYVVPSAVDLVRGVIDTSYEAPPDVLDAIHATQEAE